MSELTEIGGETQLMVREPGAIEAASRRQWAIDLEKLLASEKLKVQRREARDFMCVRDQVLVILCEKEELSETGLIVIPDQAQEKPSEGLVIAAGPGQLDGNAYIPTVVQPGDRVLFGRYAGIDITLRGRACRLLREEEILGVIR